MYIKIWQRYFLKQFASVFFLFLFCFYSLYVLIDYASHTSALSTHQIQLHWREIGRYYLFVFASRAEILLPLALLLAFVKTVCTLNARQELVALMSSGTSLKTLLRPFLMVALLCTLLNYANEEYLLPQALKKLRRMEDATKHQKSRHTPRLAVHSLTLEDGSLFLFQNYDTALERFFDVYWIQSIDSIYRIKYLAPHSPIPVGLFVDHLVRQPGGELLQEEAYKELPFPHMQFNPEILHSTILEPDVFSLSELWNQSHQVSTHLNEKESKLMTAFYWKLTIPWLCLLAILAPAPFCVRFSRQMPLFLIYVCSLFGLIAFYLLIDAAQVVAKRQVIAPFWAILIPFLVVFSYFSVRFVKMR